MPQSDPPAPRAFISYSWDDTAHKEWVKRLASRLRADGVDVTLDRWHAAPGDQIPVFMERAVRENDFVIAICTPRFKERSDGRGGGVGYEGDIMTAYAFTGEARKKFIPVLRRGQWTEAAPTWLLGRARIELSGDPYPELEYDELLRTLHGAREQAPPLGPRPHFGGAPLLPATPAPGGVATMTACHWDLTIAASVDAMDPPKIDAILDQLRSISGAMTIRFVALARASVILRLESSREDFELVKALFDHGRVREILGFRIIGISLLDDGQPETTDSAPGNAVPNAASAAPPNVGGGERLRTRPSSAQEVAPPGAAEPLHPAPPPHEARRVVQFNVVLVDDHPDKLRLRKKMLSLTPELPLTAQDLVITPVFQCCEPVPLGDGRIDIEETFNLVAAREPQVAIIDVNLEHDKDYRGIDLAFKLRKASENCRIVMVSEYFHQAPSFLDNVDVTRDRVDLSRPDRDAQLRSRLIEALRFHAASLAPRSHPRDPAQINRPVYISYSTADLSKVVAGQKPLVARIDTALLKHGYDIRRHTGRLPYGERISAFMKQIGRAPCIVVLASDSYFRSAYCMNELLEMYRNDGFHERVCPVVFPDAPVREPAGRKAYIDHWSNDIKEYESLLKDIGLARLDRQELDEYYNHVEIANNANKLCKFIADMSYITPGEVVKRDFAVLRKRIDLCLGLDH